MSKHASQLNILMLSHRQPSLAGEKGGGADADVAPRHAEYGQHVGHLDIIIHSSRADNFPVQKLAKNVTVYPSNSVRRLFFIKDAQTLASGIAASHPPDLIVAQDPFILGLVGLRLKKKFHVPLLVHFHGDFWDNPYFVIEHPRNKLLIPISKRVVKNADAVRVVSPLIAEKIKKVFPDKSIAVIPTPVDLLKFSSTDANLVKKIKSEYGEKLILYVGRLEVEKNVSLLLKAFKLIQKGEPFAKVLILGQGSELGMLRQYSNQQGWQDKVFFRGNIPHEDLGAYYHAAKVLALPSNSESFGKVILEAAAAGVPTVATATTGAKTLVLDGETGFLVKIGDAEGFARKIVSLLEDDNLRKSMGELAKKHARENYSREENISKIIKLWEEVANT